MKVLKTRLPQVLTVAIWVNGVSDLELLTG